MIPHEDPAIAFAPPRGLANAHVQSLLSAWPLRTLLLRRSAAALLAASRPEVIECADGVRLLGYYAAQPRASRGLVILLHGWEGGAESGYVLSAGTACFEAGFDVFRLNFRDHGGSHALNEELFHSCRIDEVVDAVAGITRLHEAAHHVLAGFSLGGNFALRVAARAGAADLRLTKALAVCPVLEPRHTMRMLEEGLWVYRRYFLGRWRRSLLAKAAAHPGIYEFGDLARFPTLTATTEFFVERYTQFPDLASYLDGYAVTGDVLANLAVDSRIIAALDDPIIPSADLERLAPSAALRVTPLGGGGHCGFLAGYGLQSWVDREIVRELEAL